MRKLLIAIIFGVLSSLPALANWTGKDATPATITFYNPAVCTSVVCVPVFQITDGTNQVTLTTAGADGVSNTLTGVPAYSRNLLWNGTTWDRQQGIGGAASVTVASGAVASGAYSAGSLAAGAGVDGWSLTAGAKGDTPATLPATTTAASEIALLKAIANAANAPAQLAVNVTPTDCSGTVTTGGTPVNAFTAQTTLHGFTILNDDTSEPLWISFTTTAAASTAGSYPLAPATATSFAGASSYTAPPGFGTNHALSVVAATTAHKFSCTWW